MNSIAHGPAVPDRTIHEEVIRTAGRYPDRIAVRDRTEALTYAELVREARHVAAELSRRGVGPGRIVPVLARRSARLPAHLIGVLLTGAAYAMLDVRWPQARTAALVEAMGADLVLTDDEGAQRSAGLPAESRTFAELRAARQDGPAPDLPRVPPQDAATVFWTSGSTGAPKGVLSPHRATTRLFTTDSDLPWGPAPVLVNAAAVAWDVYTLEVWSMLIRGGTLLVHDDDLLLPAAVRSYIEDGGATHLFLTPALFDALVDLDPGSLSGLEVLMLGGERLSPDSCGKLMAAEPGIEIHNIYGPVESCAYVSTHRVTEKDLTAEGGIPVGRPVPGSGLMVLRDGVPVPYGEEGEIALTGSGLALGYLNSPERTAESFRDLDIAGERRRVYLTGDHGWLDETGTLHFSGRKDGQFKLAGHRIEPGEVEAAARAAGCGQSVAVPVRDRTGTRRLVLFATTAPAGEALTPQTVTDRLRERLPAYMVPSRVHFVEEFPLLDNTKIDKKEVSRAHGYEL
ncbi:amino acid adenylation domain-containing protein [Streptomyces sclerotialus]|uniref:amino acid adenylation domain-containing protein n=1 Tax=Streptomyces sclerotialus TaxID=1957 RepID=UPI000690AD73